jgi:hypothetical protein
LHDAVGLEKRRPTSAVLRCVARPEDRPAAFGRRREQWLGCRVETKRAAEVHDEKAIVATVPEEAQQESALAQHGTVEAIRAASADHRILASKPEQVAVERVSRCVALAL